MEPDKTAEAPNDNNNTLMAVKNGNIVEKKLGG